MEHQLHNKILNLFSKIGLITANRIFFKIQDSFFSFISRQMKSTEYKIRKKIKIKLLKQEKHFY